jgi:hypothetical protein
MANAEGGIGWIQGEGLCSQLCASCNITPPLTNDHDIDALISALTAIAPPEEVCSKSDYVELLNRVGKWYEPPKGFRLFKRIPVWSGLVAFAVRSRRVRRRAVLARRSKPP